MINLFITIALCFTIAASAKEKSITMPTTSIRFELNKDTEIKQATLEVLCLKNRNNWNPMESHSTACDGLKINGTDYRKIILQKLDNEHYVLPITEITFDSKSQAFACIKINVTINGHFQDPVGEIFKAPFDYFSLLSYCTEAKIPSFVGFDLSGLYGHRAKTLDAFISKLNEIIPVILK